jgi:hypothetical protein
MRRVWVFGVLLVLTLCATFVSSFSPSRSASASHSALELVRFTRVLDFSQDHWRVSCETQGGITSCSSSTLYAWALKVPSSMPRADALVSLTLDFRSTRFDFAQVETQYGRSPSTPVAMQPPSFPVSSPAIASSATLMWTADDLSGGTQYVFASTVVPRDGDHNGKADISGVHVLVVVDFTPASQ